MEFDILVSKKYEQKRKLAFKMLMKYHLACTMQYYILAASTSIILQIGRW